MRRIELGRACCLSPDSTVRPSLIVRTYVNQFEVGNDCQWATFIVPWLCSRFWGLNSAVWMEATASCQSLHLVALHITAQYRAPTLLYAFLIAYKLCSHAIMLVSNCDQEQTRHLIVQQHSHASGAAQGIACHASLPMCHTGYKGGH